MVIDLLILFFKEDLLISIVELLKLFMKECAPLADDTVTVPLLELLCLCS